MISATPYQVCLVQNFPDIALGLIHQADMLKTFGRFQCEPCTFTLFNGQLDIKVRFLRHDMVSQPGEIFRS